MTDAHAPRWFPLRDAELVVGAIAGIEASQLRALVKELAAVDPDARVSLALTDDGVLHARVDQPDRPRLWLAVTDRSEVLPRIGPAASVAGELGVAES